MGRISRWFPPFTGVLFVAFVVAITILIGQGQDATKKTAQEIVNHYQDHNTRESVGAILIVFASSLILYFGGWLRRLLRDAEGPDGILSAVAFGGTIAFAAGAAVAGSIHLALADLADDINPIALQAINGIDFDMFFFFPVGPRDIGARHRDLGGAPRRPAEVAGLDQRRARRALLHARVLHFLLHRAALVPGREHLGDQARAGEGCGPGGPGSSSSRVVDRRRGGHLAAPPPARLQSWGETRQVPRPRRSRIAALSREVDRSRQGARGRRGGHRSRPRRRRAIQRRGGRPTGRAGAARGLGGQQAARRRLDRARARQETGGHRTGRLPAPALPSRPPGRGLDWIDIAHQRRGAGEPADPSAVRRSEDLPGAPGQAALRARLGPTARRCPTRRGERQRPPRSSGSASASSRSPSGRGASVRCAGWPRRSATRWRN